ncbi:hypothetical protein QQF64_031772 [Cirrhinus molitorella]|uniref:ribonuclease H n=1 Tax=Cirrhinus molitorella TaxID=172907 RepID=A0ABR3MXX6_9TELE
MVDRARRSLVWDIRKCLITLSADELFRVAKIVGPVPGRDQSELDPEDSENCFDHINAFMTCEFLLESEDQGMSELLSLQETVNSVKQLCTVAYSQEINKDIQTTSKPQSLNTTDPVQPTSSFNVTGSGDIRKAGADTDTEVQRMLSDYEELSKKLRQYMSTPTQHNTLAQHMQTSETTQHTSQPEVAKQLHSDRVFPVSSLSYIPHREFKIHGGQIGDHTSDITYNNVCRQIDNGFKENFSDAEIVRGVLRIIKPGFFKDMLMNKEDMTIRELKGFLQSHLGDRSSTELFQELMCTKQSEHETPQQFLYRVMGLKQKILFAARQAGSDKKYNPATVQDVFLHTVYQGLGHKCKDIRSELKPLLADSNISDDEILKHVMKVTSEENERLRRLGAPSRSKSSMASCAQLSQEPATETKAVKETPEMKCHSDTITQLTAKIDALTSMVDTMKHSTSPSPRSSCECSASKSTAHHITRPRGCPQCVERGLQGCAHCFICGQEGHRAVGCLRKPQRQGNEKRSLKGGDHALLDTGAQVSIIDHIWKEQYLPDVEVRPLRELLGYHDNLEVCAVNGEPIPFDGWAIITVNLSGNDDPTLSINVPFLVSRLQIERPLLGFNVVEELIQGQPERLMPTLVSLLAEAIDVPSTKARSLINVVQTIDRGCDDNRLKVGQHDVVISAGQMVWVKCRIPQNMTQLGTVILFEPQEDNAALTRLDIGEGLLEIHSKTSPYVSIPVGNNTWSDVTIPRGTVIGTVQQIEKIVDLERSTKPKHTARIQTAATPVNKVNPPLWNPPVDLKHLNERQQGIVKRMLYEESATFSRDADDIGCIPSLQMQISLKDDIPVQRAYSTVPKPLFNEVKGYIQDLLAKGWIVKSKSPFAAPVVCVRKKDGNLRLCVDYRLLNKKTVPDRHPLPRIQDLIDTLGGYSWFSILDQGKAYHQGFIAEGSRHMTAFITI